MENALGILVSRFRVLLTTMEQQPKVVKDIILTCVAQHLKDILGRRSPITEPTYPPAIIQQLLCAEVARIYQSLVGLFFYSNNFI